MSLQQIDTINTKKTIAGIRGDKERIKYEKFKTFRIVNNHNRN